MTPLSVKAFLWFALGYLCVVVHLWMTALGLRSAHFPRHRELVGRLTVPVCFVIAAAVILLGLGNVLKLSVLALRK